MAEKLMTTIIAIPIKKAFLRNLYAHQLLEDFWTEVDKTLKKLGVEGYKMRIKAVKIGIMPQKEIRARTLAIARGEYRPKADEPKIWFTSVRSLAEVLSDENRALLEVIMEKKPHSIRELADLTGRQSSNLSRTLKTLSGYGFVKLEKINKTVYPVAKATKFNITLGTHWDKRTLGSGQR